MEFNKNQRKRDRIHARGLLETELMNGKIENENELDIDIELNEVHGLTHLHASDEELNTLLSSVAY